ncbi:MAG: phospholipid carrier-dependent glycosyltransferase, partial [Gemmatimonadetes bacterium]|nr:phospholipid carrier-dependent glycosyltransferase [Gemmatimonadota bacterium]
LAQALLSVLTTFLVYRIGRRIRGERVGFWAASLLAFYPSHVAFAHYLWSETLYTFFAVLAFHRLLAADDEGSGWGAAIGAGVALGFASLARSLGLVLLGVSLVWLVTGGRSVAGGGVAGWRALLGTARSRRTAAIVAVTAAAIVTPWSMRASSIAGSFVAVDVNGGFNFWSGNNEYIPYDTQGIWSVGLPLENGLDERFLRYYPDDEFRRIVPRRMAEAGLESAQGAEASAWYLAEARRELARDPMGLLRRAPKKLAALWAPDFFLPRHLLRDWYGPTSPGLAALLVLLTWAAAAVALIGGPMAIVSLRRDRFRSLVLVWLGAYAVLHGLAYGHTRMHQPLVPMLLLAGAAFWRDPECRPDWRRYLRRGTPVAALVLAGWVAIYPLLGGLYVHPGPRHAGMARVLAAGREFPLPGTERQLWMLAGVEASLGNVEQATRMLAESRHADRPWTHVMRALTATTAADAEASLDRALELRPGLEAAVELKSRIPSAR